MVDGTVDSKDNKEEKTREDIRSTWSKGESSWRNGEGLFVTFKRGLFAVGAPDVLSSHNIAGPASARRQNWNFSSLTFAEFPFGPGPNLMDAEHFSAKSKHLPKLHLSCRETISQRKNYLSFIWSYFLIKKTKPMAKLNLKLMLWKFACCSAWHCVLKCKQTNIKTSGRDSNWECVNINFRNLGRVFDCSSNQDVFLSPHRPV